MKSKKLLLGSLSAMALVATPIATVVSCGKKPDTNTYTKLDKKMRDGLVRRLDDAPKTETNEQYIDYIKEQFVEFTKKDGKDLDLSSLNKITGKTDADVKKVLEAAKKIDVYKPKIKASNTVLGVFWEQIKLDKILSKAELKTLRDKDVIVKTPGNAAAAAVTAAAIDSKQQMVAASMVNKAKDEAAILEILTHFATDTQGTAISPSTVTAAQGTGATKLAAQKTAAIALLKTTNAFTKAASAVKEVKTVVTILGKDYTLKSFANDQTDKKINVVNAGLAKDVPAKLQVIKFRAQVKDVATYKQAIKHFLIEEFKIFADDKGAKLNFTKLDAATTKEAVLKEAKALIVDGVSTALDLNQGR